MGLDDLSPANPDTNTSGSTGGRKRYIQPTKQEFEDCLESTGYRWEIDNKAPGKEYVYETHDYLPNENGIVLRIYSTIDKRTDKARSKGSDAIRLLVFNRHNMAIMGGRKKTLRIETYCKNLTNKIEDLFEESYSYVTRCPECNSWMVIREGKYGEFLGCTRYPDCDETVQIDD